MIIPESVTFEEAIALTQSLLSKMEAGEISPPEVSDAIAQLVKSENGARGFFVTYLTWEGTLADNPSAEVISALQSSPDIVAELLVKNLAMSAAQAFAHRRHCDEQMALPEDRSRHSWSYWNSLKKKLNGVRRHDFFNIHAANSGVVVKLADESVSTMADRSAGKW